MACAFVVVFGVRFREQVHDEEIHEEERAERLEKAPQKLASRTRERTAKSTMEATRSIREIVFNTGSGLLSFMA